MNSEEKNDHDPDYAVPPGETLLETIEHLELSRQELAQRMDCSVKTVHQLAQGKASLTAETALKLEKITGIHSSFWNNAEANYRKRLARNKEQKAIHSQVDWVKQFSYAKMSARNFVPKTRNEEEQVRNLLRFFGVASPKQWESVYGQLQGAARESKSCKSELGDFSAWLRAGEIKARHILAKPYSTKSFQKALQQIWRLTRENPAEIWPQVIKLCANAGVAIVIVPELPKTHVFGFTRWLTQRKALLQLSDRYKIDDMFPWFTFFHEAAHILLHGKQNSFVEFRGADKSKEEQEADQWAEEFLFPQFHFPQQDRQRFLQSIPSSPSARAIQSFAEETGVAEGIVLGRLQHRGKRIPKNRFNHLKRKLDMQWTGIVEASD